MNSRTGELPDTLESDNLDRFIDSVEPDEIPNISKRCSMDKTLNAYGRKLLQLCYDTDLTIANGRLGKDIQGKYTFCSSKGQSVNDYLLLNPKDYDLVYDFDVLDFTELSDHAPLSFDINILNGFVYDNLPRTHKYLRWDSSRNHEYIQLLLEHRDELMTLVRNATSSENVNNAVKEISRILYDNAFKVFGKRILIDNSTNKKQQKNEWFNCNCERKRRTFHSMRNFYQRHPTDANRYEYILARNDYNKSKRIARTRFKRAKGIELCEIAKTNPRKFWSAVRPRRPPTNLVDNDLLTNHFENLLGSNPPDICGEVINLIDSSFFNDISIDSLDSVISEEEIVQAIGKLKTGKSAGNDNIISEMFLASPNFFAPI